MKRRKILSVCAALLLAATGTVVLVAYVRAAESRALAGEITVDVLVVSEQVSRGTAAEGLAPLVSTQTVPAKVRADGAIESVEQLERLDGKVAAVDLLPGEQVVPARFITPRELVAQTGVDVPDGLLQVTVSLEPQRALGGQVRPGDTVGVFASFDPFDVDGAGADGGDGGSKTPNTTHLVLHKVLVTSVQADGRATPSMTGSSEDDPETDEGPAPAPSGNLLVTLAVDAPSVERVVFAAEHGRLWLAAEPEDAPEDGTRIQTRGTVYE